MIEVDCAECGHVWDVASRLAGKRILCPECDTQVTVPRAGASADSSAGGIEPHRGVLVLGLALFSLLIPVLAPLPFVMGIRDVVRMRRRVMAPDGGMSALGAIISGVISVAL